MNLRNQISIKPRVFIFVVFIAFVLLGIIGHDRHEDGVKLTLSGVIILGILGLTGICWVFYTLLRIIGVLPFRRKPGVKQSNNEKE